MSMGLCFGEKLGFQVWCPWGLLCRFHSLLENPCSLSLIKKIDQFGTGRLPLEFVQPHGSLLTAHYSQLQWRHRCQSQPETIMYMLWGCEDVQQYWNQFITADNRAKFFSLDLHARLKWNITTWNIEASSNNWPMSLWVSIWALWKDNNNLVSREIELDNHYYMNKTISEDD